MTFEIFQKSLKSDLPSKEFTPALKALWYAKKGAWEQAHETAQEIHSEEGSWIHAYLHRVEGDESNANYWYARAGRKNPKNALDEEWETISRELLK